jgi:hypothetical protein
VDLLGKALAEDGLAPPREFALKLKRRRAQCLKAEGHFRDAETAFAQLASEEAGVLRADVLTDLGLAKGKFKWLSEVEVPRFEDQKQVMLERIRKGAGEFDAAVKLEDVRRTNVHYVLGVQALLEGRDEAYGHAHNYLEQAYTGASERVDVYRETEVLPRIQLYLALAILLAFEEPQFRNAVGLMRQAAVDLPVSMWPTWMVREAVRTCLHLASAGHLELIDFLSVLLPDLLDEFALREDLLARSPLLTGRLALMAKEPKRAPESRWQCLSMLLARRLKDGAIGKAQETLDELEALAGQSSACRARWVDLLEDSRSFAPAWTEEEALYSRALMCELEGRYEDAWVLLQPLFHRAASEGRLDEAQGLLDRAKGYGLPPDQTRDAEARLAACRPAEATAAEGGRDWLAESLSRQGIMILFVGGQETQEKYDDGIRRELSERYPGLTVHFEHTGWESNWGRQLDAMEGLLDRCDAVVIMRYVRTTLGRELRKKVGAKSKLWVACTGHGKDSCTRAIVEAARQVAQKRASAMKMSRARGGA